MKIYCNYNCCKFSYKYTCIPFLSFHRNKNFQQFGGLVKGIILVFYLQRVTPYFKGVPNSIDFLKKIFSHVIPVRIIVPWFEFTNIEKDN